MEEKGEKEGEEGEDRVIRGKQNDKQIEHSAQCGCKPPEEHNRWQGEAIMMYLIRSMFAIGNLQVCVCAHPR